MGLEFPWLINPHLKRFCRFKVWSLFTVKVYGNDFSHGASP